MADPPLWLVLGASSSIARSFIRLIAAEGGEVILAGRDLADLEASAAWLITQFAWRWSIEVLFRASKQVLGIEAPQQWSREGVEKVAPWVWSMQSVIMVWYITVGRESAAAAAVREQLGEWDSEWSLRHMVQVLRRATLDATIDTNCADQAQLCEMVQTLKNWANLAA